MSEIKVNSIKGVGASQAAFTIDNTSGSATANLTTVNSVVMPNGGSFYNKNLAINGADMMVAQRGTSTTGLQNTGGVYTVDRFAHRRGGTWANAQFKHEQVDSGTGLFKKALKVTTTTAEGSPAASGKYVMIGHYLEAQDSLAHFGDGTAEAKSFTVSFYAKASIATTYAVHMSTAHLATEKKYIIPFTVSSANTWERKTCTFPAITNSIGTVDVTGNATGIKFHWVLDAPTGSESANTYLTSTGGDFEYPSGQSPSGFANTLNATFELSGVQIEAGSVATELQHKTFAEEEMLCRRYYQKTPISSNGSTATYGCRYSTSSGFVIIKHVPPMRAVPSLNWSTRATSAGFSYSNYSGDELTQVIMTAASPYLTGAVLDAEL